MTGGKPKGSHGAVNPQKLRAEGFGFLYKISHLKQTTLSSIAYVPEFISAMKQFKGDLSDKQIYSILKTEIIKMKLSGTCTSSATNVMNKVSKEVTGETTTWRKDLPEKPAALVQANRQKTKL